MADYFIGEIMLVPYFRGAPSGWMKCDGTQLQISGNEVLFQVIGTTFGGDGQVNFNLPDLRGKVPVHCGQGQGLSNYFAGETGGAEQVTLTTQQMPTHNHPMLAVSSPGTQAAPSAGGALATMGTDNNKAQAYVSPGGTQTNLNGSSIGFVGGNQPHPNIQPSQVMQYIICVQGQFPTPT